MLLYPMAAKDQALVNRAILENSLRDEVKALLDRVPLLDNLQIGSLIELLKVAQPTGQPATGTDPIGRKAS